MEPPRRGDSPGRRTPSPDADVLHFLHQQQRKRSLSPDSAAFRQQRLASGGAVHRKSRYDRDREEEARRRREEEQGMASAYRDWLDDVEGSKDSHGRYSRQGAPQSAHRNYTGAKLESAFVRSGGAPYQPSTLPDQRAGSSSLGHTRRPAAFDDDEEDANVVDVQQYNTSEPLAKRKGAAMQDFLGELQRDQARREERLRPHLAEGQSISSLMAQESQGRRRGERPQQLSHNVCVLNLPDGVDEHQLGHHFCRFGDVASVKIMWPRIEDSRGHGSYGGLTSRKGGATGFVNFMERRDAERALSESDGFQWNGSYLRTNWGKCLPLPRRPRYARSGRQEEMGAGHRYDRESSAATNRRRPVENRRPGPSAVLIQFDDEGYASFYSTESDEESEWERNKANGGQTGGLLLPLAQRRLDAMLRSLTLRRERIARVMYLAIQHALYADAISQRLVASLLLPSTPLPRKLARLYALSDILHNSSATASGAWRYRAALQPRLERIFHHWGQLARAFGGRIRQEACLEPVRSLLDVWEGWMVFDTSQLRRWREALQRGADGTLSRPDAQTDVTAKHADVDPEASQPSRAIEQVTDPIDTDIREQEEIKIDEEDLDGEEIEEDIDGEAIEDEDIDGEAIDEDIDGEPFLEEARTAQYFTYDLP